MEAQRAADSSEAVDVSGVEAAAVPAAKKKVFILVDLPNLNGVQDTMRMAIDIAGLKTELIGERDLFEARLYMKGPFRSKQQQGFAFFAKMRGYTVVFTENNEDIDHLIIRDIQDRSQETDVIVLVSGDGDYIEALREAKKDGKEIEVVSVEGAISPELGNLADRYIDLRSLREVIIDDDRTTQRYGAPIPEIPELLPVLRPLCLEEKAVVRFLVQQLRVHRISELTFKPGGGEIIVMQASLSPRDIPAGRNGR